jgi:hypothetical protein
MFGTMNPRFPSPDTRQQRGRAALTTDDRAVDRLDREKHRDM